MSVTLVTKNAILVLNISYFKSFQKCISVLRVICYNFFLIRFLYLRLPHGLLSLCVFAYTLDNSGLYSTEYKRFLLYT